MANVTPAFLGTMQLGLAQLGPPIPAIPIVAPPLAVMQQVAAQIAALAATSTTSSVSISVPITGVTTPA